MRRYGLLLPLLALVGCGGGGQMGKAAPAHSSTPTVATVYFSAAMVGQTWRFRNGYGEETDIEIQRGPENAGCSTGPSVIWHYTKTAEHAYWSPGSAGAELWFVLVEDGNDWRSVASLISTPSGIFNGRTTTASTLDPLPTGATAVYTVIPQPGEDHHTSYAAAWDFSRLTYQCLPATPGAITSWHDMGTATTVATPFYTGSAMMSEQWEACVEAPAQCAHERWWFAPDLGLVKVEVLSPQHDPNLTMLRVQ